MAGIQCRYVDPTTGLRCGSHFASEKTGQYCYFHGISTINPETGLAFINRDKEEQRKQRLRAFQAERDRKRADGTLPPSKFNKKTPRWMREIKYGIGEEGKKGEEDQAVAADVLMHRILQDKMFSAKDYYVELTKGSTDAAVKKRAAEVTIVKWFLSDEFTRRPQEKYELAKVFDITSAQVDIFVEKSEFGKMYDNGRKRLMRRMAFFIDKINMKKALQGKREAITEFYDEFKRLKIADGEEIPEFRQSIDEQTELEAAEDKDSRKTEPKNMKLGEAEREMEAKLIESMGNGEADWN